MRQKNISVPEDLYNELQGIRQREHLSWIGLMERAIKRSGVRGKYEEFLWMLDRKLQSPLAQRFRDGELKMSLLFLKPITKELLIKQHQDFGKLPDEIVDELVWEGLGNAEK